MSTENYKVPIGTQFATVRTLIEYEKQQTINDCQNLSEDSLKNIFKEVIKKMTNFKKGGISYVELSSSARGGGKTLTDSEKKAYAIPSIRIISSGDIIRTSNYGPDKDWDSDEFALGE